MNKRIHHYFDADGVLDRKLPGFQPRSEQMQVAEAIAHALRKTGTITLVEAATGVGKTFAYLVPIADFATPDRKVIISTHTLALQGQLLEKDIPTLKSLVPTMGDVAVVKGRGNYLCLHELDAARSDLWTIGDEQFAQITQWSRTTEHGDVAELPFSYSGWQDIRANVDTCRANDCRYFKDCFYYEARRRAAEASIVIVNHALFFHDLAMRQRGEFGATILPDYSFVVFDEAHRLEDAAAGAFGIAFGSSRVPLILERLRRLGRHIEMDRDRMRALESSNDALFAPFGAATKQEFLIDEVIGDAGPDQEAKLTVAAMATHMDALSVDLLKQDLHGDPVLKDRVDGIRRQLAKAKEELQLVMSGKKDNFLRWGSRAGARPGYVPRAGRRTPVTLNWTPVDVAPLLSDSLWSPDRDSGAALVSATLATDGGFEYFKERIGIDKNDPNLTESIVGSTFDYPSQCLLYIPRQMPLPSEDASYLDSVIDNIRLLIEASRGGAFLLFTSHRALIAAHERLIELGCPFPLFRQGDMPNARLVEAFRESENGVLLGTHSFWEGVDVPGDRLRLVVIDRIPFAMPDSPLHRARVERITNAGGDWFGDFALPQAQIRLKQGFGRLIRSTADRGVVALLDVRLLRKNYGSRILQSLPRAKRAHDLVTVERFFAEMQQETGTHPGSLHPEGTRRHPSLKGEDG